MTKINAYMSNGDIKCRSLILSNEIFKNRQKYKGRQK